MGAADTQQKRMLVPTLLTTLMLARLSLSDECHLTPVIHVLQYPGCIPKPIPSFACTGKCTLCSGVRQPYLADRAQLHVLPGERREGGHGRPLLPQGRL